MLYQNILETIGRTPMVKLNYLNKIRTDVDVYAKLESFNPSGSVKDRMALYIIEDAEERGVLMPGQTIVENTSGNTGAALAMIAVVKGYKAVFTMPDKMSQEKQNTLKAFGAEVIVTKTDVPHNHPDSYYMVAKRIASERKGFYVDQYNNLKNIEAHYKITGPEIWQDMSGRIDYLVAGIGTGGTLSGTAKYLKKKNPGVKVVAVDPAGSIFYDYFKKGKLGKPKVYDIEGIGEDYLVKAVDFSVIDEMYQITDKEAISETRLLAESEGIFAGGSSGAAISAVKKLIKKVEPQSRIVVIFPDSGFKYLSKIFNSEWLKKKNYL